MELNPNHPVTREMYGQWHKVLAMVMYKFGVDHVEITVEDMISLGDGTKAVVAEEKGDVLHIRLVSMAGGERLARDAGGLSD